jgi:hypothetical protein
MTLGGHWRGVNVAYAARASPAMSVPLRLPSARTFTPTDYAALDRGHAALRTRAVRLVIATDYLGRPAVAEVYWPGDAEVRWLIYRDGSTVTVDDLCGDVQSAPTVEAAIEAITSTLQADLFAAINAIPTALERR